jgi:hypothetical protein
LVTEGRNLSAIAVALGISRHLCNRRCIVLGIKARVRVAKQGKKCSEGRWNKVDAMLTRCRCGLLLPCDDHGPTIWQLATSRRGAIIET